MIKFSRWYLCKNTPPKKDGDYMVARFNERGELNYCACLGYTAKYGWNTHAYSHDYPIVFEDNTMWTEVKNVKEVKKK